MEIWLFILGYLVHFVGSIVLLRKIQKQKSVYGLSSDTQYMLLAATISRCIWSMYTRLIETNLAYMELICSTVVALMLAYSMWQFRHTTIKQAPSPLKATILIPAALVLAFFFHPGYKWWTVQILVAFTMYIEAVALIPQLYLMRRMHEVENVTSHYVGLLVCSRAVRLLFWVQLYWIGEHFIGLFVADLLHTLLSGDYLWLWIRKLRTGGQLIYSL
ncbi:unnamed protein product [Vitrella brassicaformis CCMP3155]|uniref:ER lumen protein-retaining receptor n=1 Tax=Vitrella brassicaformis (strain CCMP3155) TaxID=1169540 RepID=A0A0G4GD82_VITBC|nr:unnamed protein product [Vitrella brassicaformis CCMP3155]|eukprot:CEM27211.1 unnamed protein product [Vitrella brassicaformis CCMP3155]